MSCEGFTCRMSAARSSMALRARIVDDVGRPIQPTDVDRMVCMVRDLDSRRQTVHDFMVEPGEVLLPALVRDRPWTVDEAGYNFRHDLTPVAEFVEPRCGGRLEVAYVFSLRTGRQETVSFYLKLGSAACGASCERGSPELAREAASCIEY